MQVKTERKDESSLDSDQTTAQGVLAWLVNQASKNAMERMQFQARLDALVKEYREAWDACVTEAAQTLNRNRATHAAVNKVPKAFQLPWSLSAYLPQITKDDLLAAEASLKEENR